MQSLKKSMRGHRCKYPFPNFSQNAANFPNCMGPGPIPKKGCESHVCTNCAGLIQAGMS